MRPYKVFSILGLLGLGFFVWMYFQQGWSLGWALLWFAVIFSIFFLGVLKFQWNFFMHATHKLETERKVLALTFDDGVTTYTSDILAQLKALNVPAIFFLIAERANKHPDTVKQIFDEGHLIGNHSYSHATSFDWKSAKWMQADFEKANETLAQIIGRKPNFIRPPYGITNPNVAKAISGLNMHTLGWSLRSYDTMIKSPEKLKRYLLKRLHPGRIILLHDSEAVTATVLTSFIEEAKKQGYTFERLDKLLSLEAYA